MKINRLMQVVFVSGSVCAAVPAFASAALHGPVSAPSCGGDSDGDDDEGDEDDDKGDETRLCGGDEGDDDGGDDDGDDGDDGDDTETLEL